MHAEIRIEQLAERHLAAVKFRGSSADLPARLPAAFGAVLQYLERWHVAPQGGAVCVYEQLGPAEFEVAAGFFVPARISGDASVVPETTPECQAAVCTHWGAYDALPGAYAAIQEWMRREGWEPAGSRMWEEYFSGPETPPAQTRTDIYWPLRRSQPS
jgi:effector-binding domain-containing protein